VSPSPGFTTPGADALANWENEGGTVTFKQARPPSKNMPDTHRPAQFHTHRTPRPAAALVLAALAFGLERDAQAETPKRDGGGFSLVVENDLFSSTAKDRNYTSGLKAGYLTPAGQEPRWARAFADLLPGYKARLDTRFEFEIGQTMFTPRDLTLAVPDPNDRPYAGLLYGSVGLISRTEENILNQAQLVIGVVGPASQAGASQRWLHRQIPAAVQPAGWTSEIPNQFAGELRLQRTHRLPLVGNARGAQIDILPHYGASLGNLSTGLSFGVGARAGWNLPVDFGPPRVSPSLPGSGYAITDSNLGWYVFGGLEGRYVAHNLVLDERSALGARVSRMPFTADGQFGMATYIGDARIAYTQVWRSREFQSQISDYSEFGAISVSLRH
jgi:lipid A 3-O-deacylase